MGKGVLIYHDRSRDQGRDRETPRTQRRLVHPEAGIASFAASQSILQDGGKRRPSRRSRIVAGSGKVYPVSHQNRSSLQTLGCRPGQVPDRFGRVDSSIGRPVNQDAQLAGHRRLHNSYPNVRKTSLCFMAANSPRMELGFVPGMNHSSRAPRNLRQLPQSSTVRPRGMRAANSLSAFGTPLAFCPTRKL